MSNYSFDLITKTGDDIIGADSFGNTPSINDFGYVAFIGKFGSGFSAATDLFAADSQGDISLLSTLNIWRFSDQIQINNHNQIVVRDTASGLQAIRIWDVAVPGLNQLEATGGVTAGSLDFEFLYLYPSINNNNEVVFIADPKDGGTFNNAIATNRGNTTFGSRDYNEVIVPSAFVKPAIADNGTIVARETFQRIVLSDYQLNPIAVIANNASFSSLGVAPDISDDGKIVVFSGDLTNPGATQATQGLNPGKGVFISLATDSGRKIERIAGISGNGFIDPGETLNADDEDEGLISDFVLDESIGVNFNEEDGGSGTVTFLATDNDGNESLFSSQFNITREIPENEPNEVTETQVRSPNVVAHVGQEASQVSSELTGNIQDINIHDAINDSGQIAFWAKTTTGDEAVVKANPVRKPVLILPGIGGSFPENADFPEWLLDKGGLEPDELRIEPFSRTYDDLIETLKRAGYQEGVDLFVATYDWRLNPAPIDGTIDGEIDHSIAELTDDNHEYAVDQLAFWLEEAVEGWSSQFEGTPPELDSVDVIAHSTGGLVARSYIQSTGYGENFASSSGEQVKLPEIDNLIMLGVPNRGASLAYSPLNNDFSTGIGAALLGFLSRAALNKVRVGNTITVDGNADSPFAIRPQAPGTIIDPVEFVAKYVPTVQSLLATYPFIQPLPNNNQAVNPLQRAEEFDVDKTNNLLLDLNNGYDSLAQGENADPNIFADKEVGQVTVIHGVNAIDEISEDGEVRGGTRDAVIERDEPEYTTGFGGIQTPQRTVLPIHRVGAGSVVLPALNAEVPDGIWYRDIAGHYKDRENPDLQGDKTVPLISSVGQFNDDNFARDNIVLEPFREREGGNTTESVEHNALVYNSDVQKLILETLGAELDDNLISTNLHGPNLLQLGGALIRVNLSNLILDPVEGFIVDGQGRRLGYTSETGALTEIPGSFWLGETDGVGFVPDLVEGPFQLQLTGLGEDYYVSVALETDEGQAFLESEGFLAAGEQLTLDIPLIEQPTTSDNTIGEYGTIDNLNHVTQTIDLVNTYTDPVVFVQPPSFNGNEPALVRLDNITADSFEAMIQEPNHLDGGHARESVSYFVLEAGSWQLEDGTLLEVGTLDSSGLVLEGFDSVEFEQDFDTAPVIMSQVQSRNGGDFVRTRQQNPTADGFEVGLEEEEANRNSGHARESLGWFAIEPGSGQWGNSTYYAGQTSNSITHEWSNLDFNSLFDSIHKSWRQSLAMMAQILRVCAIVT